MYCLTTVHLPTFNGKDLYVKFDRLMQDAIPLTKDTKSIVLQYCLPLVTCKTEGYKTFYNLKYDDAEIDIRHNKYETQFPRITYLDQDIIIDYDMDTNEGVVSAFNQEISGFPRYRQDWIISFPQTNIMMLQSEYLAFELNFQTSILKKTEHDAIGVGHQLVMMPIHEKDYKKFMEGLTGKIME